MNIDTLTEKYRVAAPRYTSYPTVPYWDETGFNESAWLGRLSEAVSDADGEISLYIHLPFCESLCTYCGCNTRITKNHGVELPYIAAVLKEWQLYLAQLDVKPVIKDIHLGGGTPTFFSAENLRLLVEGILKDAETSRDAAFSIEGHPNNTTEEHLRTLYALGFRRLSLGIQDFDPKVQLIINRIQSYEDVEKVTRLAREIGFDSVNYDLIYGLPLQTLEGLQSTIDQVIRLRPDRIAFYSYAHVPWVKPGQRRYTEAHLPSAELKKALYESGRLQLSHAGYVEIGMDHFTLESDTLYQAGLTGKLHRNFMGYTELNGKVMIGLGVSSISDCWSAFAQNVKSVEEYLALITADKLPLSKGHLLSASDLLIRRHILNIMCQGQTSWSLAELMNADFEAGILRMHELAADGLVHLRPNHLGVTPIGKRFLRNICMAFDARLWEKQPQTQLFSMAD
ncbi:oxygen-independent coproporphyrinogen III oxidase [Pedobacter faecalis]|uniref:oxygen-independent coproporphyrinogen III oxidase n=1 Tax=Pedobacter faecalis TaxID=3041495 RepID=UPI00254E25C8|nr:oxygen-independent coproporphyrinogen III oxidase [Pedobacter sp. ELA7]